MKQTKFCYLIILLLCFWMSESCSNKNENNKISRGIYYWKGDINESAFEGFYGFFKEKKIEKIYFKLYDIVWDEVGGIFPSQGPFELNVNTLLNEYYTFIPCIYITNEVFINATPSEIEIMSDRINERLNTLDVKCNEVQIDCDWSKKSKENYFLFLRTLKSKLNKRYTLSATIRLFQYKNPELAGIPPVDRGALMLYNFRSPKIYSTKNSIYNENEALKYLSDHEYKLKLDFILPAFSWGIVYNEGKFVSMIHNIDSTVLNDTNLVVETKKDLYKFKRDTVLNDIYYREGNVLKIETIRDSELLSSYDLIDKFKNTNEYTISIFSINSTLKKIKNETTSKVYHLDNK